MALPGCTFGLALEPKEICMAEGVRLVIWDLDETFWKGTLTEGGIDYLQAHHEIVVALARRGIMSGICSKNDLAPIQKILTERGIWDYFIFPSVDWSPKGGRIAGIIEAAQLRPATVMFIDDNKLNLHEAKQVVPDLQTADQTIIPHLLRDPRFTGKDDTELTRLAQYKLLEKRSADMAAGGDNTAFLRASNIRVIVEHDIEANIDRAIELINRTNQMNFTKRRLPEDTGQAARQLLQLLKGWRVQAGLVRVIDDYGDHGFCGFYAFDKDVTHHFCFSCRILGMGVEQWLYARIGSPPLEIRGEVLSDPRAGPEVDWIRYVDDPGTAVIGAPAKQIGSIFIRGGCDLTAVSHYLSLTADDVVAEYNLANAGLMLRLDHSVFLRYAAEGISAAGREALRAVGYDLDKFASRFLEIVDSAEAFAFSFWGDTTFALYRHKQTGVVVPWQMDMVDYRTTDFTRLGPAFQEKLLKIPAFRDPLTALTEQFEFAGLIDKATYRDNIKAALRLIDPGKPVIITAAWEGGSPRVAKLHGDLNAWTRELAAEFPNVLVVDVKDCVASASEVMDPLHFDRRVYQRMAKKITALITEFRTAPAAAA
jgi:FkbH-like protein